MGKTFVEKVLEAPTGAIVFKKPDIILTHDNTASIYKTFTSNDIATVRDMLHEAIPLTGTIASGTYADNNIKT